MFLAMDDVARHAGLVDDDVTTRAILKAIHHAPTDEPFHLEGCAVGQLNLAGAFAEGLRETPFGSCVASLLEEEHIVFCPWKGFLLAGEVGWGWVGVACLG